MAPVAVYVLIVLAVIVGVVEIIVCNRKVKAVVADEARTLKKTAVDFAEKEATAAKNTGERVAADIMKPFKKL
jgi:uncharacterized membrane protein